jgi:hypothetical protein
MTRLLLSTLIVYLLSTIACAVHAQGEAYLRSQSTCDAPEFPGSFLITEQSATLTWALPSAFPNASFELELIETGIPFSGVPNYTGIVAPPMAVSNLLPGKTYKFRVRSLCSGGLMSSWSVESRFRTVLTNPQCGLSLLLADTSCAPETNHFRIRAANILGNALGSDVTLRAVRFTMSHTWASDMAISLVSPSGKRVLLVDSLQAGGNHFGNVTSTSCANYLELSSSCTNQSIKQGQAPFIGTFLPIQPLSIFHDGSNPNGIWTLEACDRFANDRGILQYLELIFEPLACQAPPPAVVSNISLTGAQVMIPAGMGCDSLILEYGPLGFRPGNSNLAGAQGIQQTVACAGGVVFLNNLQPFTDYTIYLRKLCAPNMYSPNSCRTNFYTDCSFPTEEENFNIQPNCALTCGTTCAISGHWINSQTDQFDWTTTSLPTPTPSTGPDADFEGTGKFAYIEVSGPACGLNRTAILESHCITVIDQPADCDMGFAYHMFGSQTGTLKVEASNNGGQTWLTIWSKTGNQGNQWFRQKIDLQAYNNQTILLRFVATSANGAAGDIAIDNIRFFGANFQNHGAFTYYRDADQDGFGNNNIFLKSCNLAPPTGYVSIGGDCNDANATIYPGAIEIYCNGIDENCNGMQDDVNNPPPIVANQSACANTPLTITAQQFTGTLYWYNASNLSLVGIGAQINVITPSANLILLAKDSISGCPSAFDTVLVSSLPTPELVLSHSAEVCQGRPLDLTQLPISDLELSGASFFYYPNSSLLASQQFPNGPVVPSGSTTYYALAITSQNCRDTLAIPVLVYNNPTAFVTQGDSLRLCLGTQAVLSATATGSPFLPFSFSWSNGLNFAQVPILAPSVQQTFTVTVSDTKGCTATDSIRVNTSTSITQTDIVQIQPVSQCGLSDGSITLLPLDGISPYTFSWSGAGGIGSMPNIIQQGTINNLASGGYRVTITDSSPGGGCGMVLPLIVVEAPNFRVDSVRVTNPTCYGQNNGRISLQITAQLPAIKWSNNAVGPEISNLPAGVYAATITDGGCQQVISQIVLTQPDSIKIQTNSITSVRCFGQSTGAIDLFVSGGTGAYQYNWSNGATNADLTQLPHGNYTVFVRDSLLCSRTRTFTITQPAQLQILVDSIFHPNCNDDSTGYLRVAFAGGVIPYTFWWENQLSAIERFGLPAGMYTVTLTDQNACTASKTQAILPPPPLQATVAFVQNPQCVGLDNGSVFIEGIGGVQPYTARWNDGPITNLVRQNLAPGNYQATITDAKGCMDTIGVQMLTAQQLIPVQSVQTTDIACFGAQTGAIEILTSNSNQLFYYVNGTIGSSTRSNLAAGQYNIKVRNAQGCSYFDTIMLNQPMAALVTQATDVEQPLCAGSATGAISVQTTGGTQPYSFSWSNGANSESLQHLSEGNYSLSVTDANFCTATLPALTIHEPTALVATVMKTDIPCFGVNVGSVVLQTQGGSMPYRYIWNTGDTTSAIFNLNAGQYSVTIIDQKGCILELKTIEIEDLRQDFEVSLVRSQNAICNNQNNGQIIVRVNQSSGPYAFNWSPPIGLRNRSIPIDTLLQLMPGSYQVTVTNGSGCVAASQVIEIFNPPILQASLDIEPIKCKGDSNGIVQILTNGGVPPYRYIWSDGGASVAARNNLPAGQYWVTMTDFNTCQMLLGPLEVTEPTEGIRVLLDTLNGGLMHDKCSSCKGSIQVLVDGGQGSYQYVWNDNNQDQDRQNLCAGMYSLTVNDMAGCTRSLGPLQILAFNDPPGFEEIRITDVACKGDSTGIIMSSVSGGTAPYDIFWSNNLVGDTLVNLPAGLYIATISDAAQCFGNFAVRVNEPDTALKVTSIVMEPTWNQNNGSITLQIIGGTPQYQVAWSPNTGGQTGTTIQNLAVGVYSATITDEAGCVILFTKDITSGTEWLIPSKDWTLTPNPAKHFVKVQGVSPSANFASKPYQIIDALSHIVLTGHLPSNGTVDLSDIATGQYLIRVQAPEGVWIGKFVKVE